MEKDLTNYTRRIVERTAKDLVKEINRESESLGIAREALIKAYDEAAAEADRAK